jgi:hypothetical protein
MPTTRDHYVCPTCGAFADFDAEQPDGVVCPGCVTLMAHETYAPQHADAPGFALIASDAIPDGLRHIDALMRRNGTRHDGT